MVLCTIRDVNNLEKQYMEPLDDGFLDLAAIRGRRPMLVQLPWHALLLKLL